MSKTSLDICTIRTVRSTHAALSCCTGKDLEFAWKIEDAFDYYAKQHPETDAAQSAKERLVALCVLWETNGY